MWTWIHAQWKVFVGLGIFVSFIPAIAIYDVLRKPLPRRGFLPIDSTPGVRFFIGALVFIYLILGWLLVVPELPIIIPFVGAFILLVVIMVWG
jgi:predicted small integral membrane protein